MALSWHEKFIIAMSALLNYQPPRGATLSDMENALLDQIAIVCETSDPEIPDSYHAILGAAYRSRGFTAAEAAIMTSDLSGGGAMDAAEEEALTENWQEGWDDLKEGDVGGWWEQTTDGWDDFWDGLGGLW